MKVSRSGPHGLHRGTFCRLGVTIMGKKKQRSESTATYGNVAHSGTADEAAYRGQIQNVDFHTPIVNAFGQAQNDINDTTFEEALPAGVAEKIKYGRTFDLNQRKGAALSDAAAREAQWKAGQAGNLAGMTQDHFVQTGGTQYGEQWGGIGQTFGNSMASSLGQA